MTGRPTDGPWCSAVCSPGHCLDSDGRCRARQEELPCACGHTQGLHGAPQVGKTMCLEADAPDCPCQQYRTPHPFDPGDHVYIEPDHLCHDCGECIGHHTDVPEYVRVML